MTRARTATLAGWVVPILLATASDAGAAFRRPRFEPTDLEMEESGMVEVDVQLGAAQDVTGLRLTMPNFEVDVGLLPDLELDVDGTVSLLRTADAGGRALTTQVDLLWVALKVGLADLSAEDGRWAFSLGLQMGPRVDVAATSDGIGAQGLLLAGLSSGRTHLVLNVGGFSDPAPRHTLARPVGLVAGLDVQVDLDDHGRVALLGEAFATHTLFDAPDEYGGSLGLQYSPSAWLDLSLVGLAGRIGGGLSYGALLGISPKLRLWR